MRALRWIAAGLAALVALLLLAAVLLALTTRSPADVDGWEELAELPSPRGEVASTVARAGEGERLVVAGGFTGRTASTSSEVHAYDPRADAWEQLPDLPQARHHAGAAALGRDIYVSGGAASVTDTGGRSNLWVLREGSDRWAELEPMPEGRQAHRMRAHAERLYVVGGRGASADTLVFDPERGRWSRAAPLPVPRHHLAVVVHQGDLWALGGRDDDEDLLDAVHAWRPGAARWREGPPLPEPLSAAAEGVLDGEIHLVGGEDPAVPGGGVIDAHRVLEVADGSWSERPPPPLAVHGAGAGVLDGRLVVAGGAARQGLLSPLAWTGFSAAREPR